MAADDVPVTRAFGNGMVARIKLTGLCSSVGGGGCAADPFAVGGVGPLHRVRRYGTVRVAESMLGCVKADTATMESRKWADAAMTINTATGCIKVYVCHTGCFFIAQPTVCV